MKKWSESYLQKVIPREEVAQKAADLRNKGKTIATLNGSFDLLHAGHMQMLYEGAQVADCLIIALNSDTSIRRYKSPNRPIVPLDLRMQMIAAIGFVDYVTWFEETDPCAIIRDIQPHVHVNGSEYGENCIEAETVKQVGGVLHLVPLIPGLSTTDLIKQIQTHP